MPRPRASLSHSPGRNAAARPLRLRAAHPLPAPEDRSAEAWPIWHVMVWGPNVEVLLHGLGAPAPPRPSETALGAAVPCVRLAQRRRVPVAHISLVLRPVIGRRRLLVVMVSWGGGRRLGLLRAATDDAVHAVQVAVTLLVEQVPPPALGALEDRHVKRILPATASHREGRFPADYVFPADYQNSWWVVFWRAGVA